MSKMLSVLEPSIQDLEETIDDFRSAQFQGVESVLARFLNLLSTEPLASFLASVLPTPDFSLWWKKNKATEGSMVGSGALDWPVDRSERVSMQIALCRALANKEIRFLDFVVDFYYSGSKLSDHLTAFASALLAPLVRDIRRLTELRPVPPILFEAMGRLPPSGDTTLDTLLQDACAKFRDPAPKARSEAAEKLWDAWERLKSLEVQGNKRVSVEALLQKASPDPAFRAYLEAEAKSLTDIGNSFHIRHFETDRKPIAQPEQFDYLFHRLYALMHFLLFNRMRSEDDA